MKHLPISSLRNTTPIPVRYLVESSGDPVVLSSKESVIQDILDGQFTRVTCILEIYEDEGGVENISEEIARAVIARATPDEYGQYGSFNDFLQEQLGCSKVEKIAAAAFFG